MASVTFQISQTKKTTNKQNYTKNPGTKYDINEHASKTEC